MSEVTVRRAAFDAMTEGTVEDWAAIAEHTAPFVTDLPSRVLSHLRLLGDDHGGFKVDRLTHSLQTATRAYRANRDDEYVLCALIHDIGDTLGPTHHAEVAAVLLKPYVSEQNHWMVDKHGVFQGYYFFHLLGGNRDEREAYRGHEWFDYTAEFCAEYDQPSFDPTYDTLPLEHFEPLVASLMSAPRAVVTSRV